MRRLLALTALMLVLGCVAAAAATAAKNPVGSGQPGTASPGGAAC
ncbi:MAG: hypothetical protein QOI03_186, partial [Solirubrobacteraceae bacterium]|nr:hypothetical protein [Solirubrobacteraceae bacterium]